MAKRIKTFPKVTGPVVNAQGYNITNWLNANVYCDQEERFAAYDGMVTIDGHRCKILADCMPVMKLGGYDDRYVAVVNIYGEIEKWIGDMPPDDKLDSIKILGFDLVHLPDGRFVRKHGGNSDWYEVKSPTSIALHPKARKYWNSAELIYNGISKKCDTADLYWFYEYVKACMVHGDDMYELENTLK